MPVDAPFSLSRDKTNAYRNAGDGPESILGKRKSELEQPPAGTKRYATISPFNKEGSDKKVYSAPCPESPSSSSDLDEYERTKHDQRADSSRDPPSLPVLAARDFPARPLANRKDIFKPRLVRRRHSASTFEPSNNLAGKAVNRQCGNDTERFTSRYMQMHRLGFPIVYRIECPDQRNKSHHHRTFLYEDDPLADNFADARRSSHLSGTKPIYRLQHYVRQFQQRSFVIVQNRHCEGHVGLSLTQRSRDEAMLILGEGLRQAIQKVSTCPLDQFLEGTSFEIKAPYQLLYFHKEPLETYAQSVDTLLRGEIETVIRYIINNYGNEYAETEKLISERRMTIRHLDKVFWPNQLVVKWNGKSGNGQSEYTNIYVVCKWPKRYGNDLMIELWRWKFNGWECYRDQNEHFVCAPVEDEMETFPLEDLCMLPLSVNTLSIATLRDLGRKSWALRHPEFIYCIGSDRVKPGRYMIDHVVYYKLHQGGSHDWSKTRNLQTDPFRLALDFCDEPTEDEFLLMPTEIPGYDLHEKEWINLSVSDIAPIRWRKQLFEDLVLPEETKRLVKAMVTVRASSIKTNRERQVSENFDIVPGKGNGLIMLFHGSPGTGKTLTAESVAEIGEMPLFPITCGDIGTEPDKVENYLRLVFELGTRWNCVLLLDEADVFLEERTLADLQRNSLVSVFLRMLEYYEGILILTSNRVGTFDEAFRSRINIALHYEDLKPRSRKKIWSNFLSRLEGTEEGENVDEIEGRLDELAKHKLNGREIRNALSTARQLASYEGKKFDWEHLELAIKTANKFGDYLEHVHGHNDRNWVAEKRVR